MAWSSSSKYSSLQILKALLTKDLTVLRLWLAWEELSKSKSLPDLDYLNI